MSASSDPLPPARTSTKAIFILAAISLSYLIASWLLIGFKFDQVVFVVLYNGLYFATPVTRKLILGFSVFAVYWVIFDYMKAFPNYEFGDIHLRELYDAELRLFGIHSNGIVMTANEFWLTHTATWLDVMTGLFYLCWIPVPLTFAVILFFRDRDLFLRFSLTFLVANFVGFAIYYSYPAAPPWYFREFGMVFHPNTPGGIAGLARFDDYFHVSIFQSIYAKSSNVFAAMPSLHSAYPLVVLYYGIKTKLGIGNVVLAIVTTGIWFAAIYTSHHYILDVIVGILCALAGIALFNLLLKVEILKRLFDRYLAIIR